MPAEKATTFRQSLQNDPSVERDEGDPAWSRLRLLVPDHLLGTDRSEHRKGVTERKVLSQQSKAAALGDDEVGKLREEMKNGFRQPFSANDALTSMHTTLAPGSMSIPCLEDAKNKDTSSSALLETAQEIISPVNSHSGNRAPSAGAAAAPAAGQPKASASPPADIRLDRDRARRNLSTDLEKSLKKTKSTILDAVVLLGQVGINATDDVDLVSTLDEMIVNGTKRMASSSDYTKSEGIELKNEHVTVTSWFDSIKPDPSDNSCLDDVILHYFPGTQTLKTETESCTMKRGHIITNLGKASQVPEGAQRLPVRDI